jgi:hypothetical protein
MESGKRFTIGQLAKVAEVNPRIVRFEEWNQLVEQIHKGQLVRIQ